MASVIVVALFPLIALILMGYVLKHSGFISEGFWPNVEKLNYYILFPAMLFMALGSANIELAALSRIIQVLAIVLVCACTILYLMRYFFKTPAKRFGVYVQSIIRFNTYIGLAIVAILLGQQGMTLFAILMAVSIPVVNILSVLAMTKPEDMNIVGVFKSLAKNPMILSCLVGVAFNASNFALWDWTENFLKQLGACSLPLGLLTIGAALRFDGFKADILPLIFNTFGRLLLMPLFTLVLCYGLQLPKLETQVIVLFFALPTASASYILTKVLHGDSEMMANVISLQIICAMLTLPLMIYFIM